MNDATPLGSLGAVCRQEVGKIYQLSLIFTSVYNYRMDSRKYFVEQVASTIIKNHDHEDDSFIFGISGKWGEGKTRFLQDLEKELKKRDETFEILWINPWKFASDKISFLRAFLGKLHSPKLCFYSKVRAFLRNPTESRELYFDVSRD